MRRILLLLFFVLSICSISGAETRKRALLIGVDDYANVSSLECCVNDMKALKEALLKIDFKEDDIQTLLTDATKFKDMPTKRNIERRISNLLSDAQPSDMIFIAFSGHGAQEGTKVFFCPPDVEMEYLEETCVSINKVMDDLASCKAKFKLMVVDACRNDPNQGPKGIGGKEWRGISAHPAGFALFQSCNEGEESWEDRDSGNSFFTKNLVAALSGEADSDHDGKLTLFEVCTWTTAQTKAQVQKYLNKSQKPYLDLSASDFALSENLNVKRAKELVEEARKAMKEKDYELSVKIFDDALALWRFDAWELERDIAQKLLQKEQALNEASKPKLQYTSRDSFEWEGSKITKFIGNEKHVVIPEGTTAVGINAFFGAPVESVIIPDFVTELEGFSFSFCKMESVSIPGNITLGGLSIFDHCKNLKSVTLSPGLKTIRKGMFMNCTSLTTITIPESVTKFESLAFAHCTSLRSINIPDNVSSFGNGVFTNCPELKVWRISPTHPYFKSDGMLLLSKDGKKLIACPGVEGKFRVPNGVTEINGWAFNSTQSVTSVIIPEGVTKIGYAAFSDSSVTSVVIPDSVTEIEDNAFYNCPKLTVFTSEGSVAEQYAKKAGVPVQIIHEKERTVKNDVSPKQTPASRDSFQWKDSKITKFIGNETDVVIPEGTTAIGAFAFNNKPVKSVVIPDGVTKIDKFTFYHCNVLTSIDIAKDVSTIGETAFCNCPALKTWRIDSSNSYFKSEGIALLSKDGRKLIACPGAEGEYQIPESVTEIGYGAFSECQNLKSVIIPQCLRVIEPHAFDHCHMLSSIVIPENVTEIGSCAFQDCTSLTSVVIPERVTWIGDGAFSGCSKLTIYGSAGSKAEEFAKQRRIPFQVKQ